MTKASYEQLTKAAVSELPETVTDPNKYDQAEFNFSVLTALKKKDSSTARLKQTLLGDKSLTAIHKGWIRYGADSGASLQDHAPLMILIEAVVNGKKVAPIIRYLRDFAKSQTARVENFYPLVGVRFSQSATLDDGARLLKWDDVPECMQKAYFQSGKVQVPGVPPAYMFPYREAVASSAIRFQSPKCPVLFKSHKEAKKAHILAKKLSEQDRMVADVLRMITAASAFLAVGTVGSWSSFDNSIANRLCPSGYTVRGNMNDSALVKASENPVVVNSRTIAKMYQRFAGMNEGERETLRIALDRISQALREPNLVDKAIDIGIALEVMLLHEMGGGFQGEMTYRTSVRGAALLGKTQNERLEILRAIKRIYGYRSEAVHTGKIKRNNQQTEKDLGSAIRLCAQIATKVIEYGSFPNWDEQYVLRGR